MGTNYYYIDKKNHCDVCGRYDSEAELHIGKSSGGWVFCFRGHKNFGLTSFSAWVSFFRANKGIIKDQYGETHTIFDFCVMVKGSIKANNNMYDYAMEDENLNISQYWKDKDGFPFDSKEFS